MLKSKLRLKRLTHAHKYYEAEFQCSIKLQLFDDGIIFN